MLRLRGVLKRSRCLLLVALVGLAGCGTNDPQSPPSPGQAGPVRIGVIAPFFTTPGEGIRNGVAMAVKEINASGGILGRSVEVIEADDGFSPSKATLAYQKLASRDQVTVVIGLAGSGIFPVMEQLARHRVPVLGTGVGADKLSEMVQQSPDKYGLFFRVMHRSSELAAVTSEYLKEYLHKELGLKKFAILVEDDIWTKYLRDEWKAAIKSVPGMELVFEDTFNQTTTDFTALFTRIKAQGAEYVLDASSQVPSALYLKAWGLTKGPLIGAVPTGAGTKKYYDEIGDTGTGVFTVGVIPSKHNPITARAPEWHAKYFEKYSDPEYTSAYSYDAVYILKEALERAKSSDSQALAAELNKTDHAGVMGRFVFDTGHSPKFGKGYRHINMLQYQFPAADGYRVIWPADRAVAKFQAPVWWSDGKAPASPSPQR